MNTRITRYEIEVSADYILYKKSKNGSKKQVFSSKLSKKASHRVLPDNISSTLSSEATATKIVCRNIAQNIYDELVIAFVSGYVK